MSLLEVTDLEAGYGDIAVVRGISFAVRAGEVMAILGPNGSGKTTTLRAVSGLLKPRGKVAFDGAPIAGKPAEQIARIGIAHVPEGRGTFPALSAEENLRVGAYRRRDRAGVDRDVERCLEHFPPLRERRAERAGNLSGGEQQMLAIARGLMLRPRLLLLDEPSLGLAPAVARDVFRILGELTGEEGATVLIVEQNAKLALDLADRAHVLEAGSIVASGDSDRVRRGDAVRRAYLGA